VGVEEIHGEEFLFNWVLVCGVGPVFIGEGCDGLFLGDEVDGLCD
jgi:hypothetical protein